MTAISLMSAHASRRRPLRVLLAIGAATELHTLQVLLGASATETVTLAAATAAQAVAACQRESPDVVILDAALAAEDGHETTRFIKAVGGRWIPVLLLAALDDQDALVKGLDAGVDDFLPKPVDPVVLEVRLRSIRRVMGMQRSLEDEHQRLAAVSDNLVDGIIVIDALGRVQSCNPAAQQMFGYNLSEMLGQNVSMLMPEPYRSEHDGYVARYVAGGPPRVLGIGQREVRGQRKNGEIFPMDLGVSEMRVAGSRQFVGVLHDASERVAAQQRLRENAERLQAYYDTQEASSALAQKIVSRQMQRPGLDDASVRYWLAAAANFSGDIVAAARGPAGDLYVLLADASGHGLGAAVCTLPVLSVFYSMSETGVALGWIVHEVNRQLRESLPVGYFVAASALRIDADGCHGEVWIGGTPDLLVLDAAGCARRLVTSTNLPLGIDFQEQDSIRPERIDLHPGDQLVLFSDGLVEAENHAGEPFGYSRLLAALGSSAAANRLDAVKQALADHLCGALAHDDVSFMLIACHGARRGHA